MTIALGMIFGVLLLMAVWMAANEPAEIVLATHQVEPDQTDDTSGWDLMGWHSFG
ncbi:MAG: hypothetical protein QOK43_2855 [Acidimicrobiaceae bacterium]|jgi:hypothetical protein|nr:hypothetical protein [Acidimicrobiaceae bacterium]MDQ1445660.1 hypothetical protein [Acidimicrobiaceae bacterium]